MVQKEVSNTKGIETIICMGPYGPEMTKELLTYRIDIIYLPTYWLESRLWDFYPIPGARIFHRGPFIDSWKIFEEFQSSQKNDYPPMSKMCQLKLKDLKFVTIFMVYKQECVDVRLKSLIYRCENHS